MLLKITLKSIAGRLQSTEKNQIKSQARPIRITLNQKHHRIQIILSSVNIPLPDFFHLLGLFWYNR